MNKNMKRNRVEVFDRALNWIKNNTLDGCGITVTSKEKYIYPEVTGYYIPSLLQWGERDLAIAYAKYLCAIQKEDGSWYDSKDIAPYVFDSAQILKGLVAIRDILPEADAHIIKGCDWILSNMQPNGRLTTPSKDAWGNDEDYCSELIHLYCLTPIRDAGKLFNMPEYIEAVNNITAYYIREKRERIESFSLLSHFYAYVMEGLLDLGEVSLCRTAMQQLERYQNKKGAIPALRNVPWICSTGMFQLALVWYKLGEPEKGNVLFDYACSLQNESGGWFGSYPAPSVFAPLYKGDKHPSYFADAEISWANKYFLDALAYKMKLEFEQQSAFFSDVIDENDGRYRTVEKELRDLAQKGRRVKVCDIGCGKGRYIRNLIAAYPEHDYFAVDLSQKVMEDINDRVGKKQGSITRIPFGACSFDYVYVCEALEHALNIEGALGELWRITKPDGKIVIIDKPKEQLGKMEIDEWEQWIDGERIQKFVDSNNGKLLIIPSVGYEDKDDGLFRAWILYKAKG